MTTVAIVDDHAVFRMGTKFVLGLDKDLSFVGEAGDGAEAVALVRRTHPDILLLDVRMPGVDGITALQDVLKAVPEQKVVMMTTSDAEEHIYQSLKLGAKGYIVKDSEPETILSAVRTVAAGGMAVPEDVQKIYDIRSSEKGLTPREREILALVRKGFSNAEIGDLLGLSGNTVKIHVKNLYAELGVADRAEAVSEAIRRGILPS